MFGRYDSGAVTGCNQECGAQNNFRKVARDHSRDLKLFPAKIKLLKKNTQKVLTACSGVGMESHNDLEDHEILIRFKWFDHLHAVTWTRAVVSPPSLPDTSAVEKFTFSNPCVEEQIQSEGAAGRE